MKTQLLALLWGSFFILTSTILLWNDKMKYQIISYANKKRKIISFITLFLGLLHILLHNTWIDLEHTFISALGLIMLLKGVFNYISPKGIEWGEKIASSSFYNYYLVIILCFGVYLFSLGINKSIL